MGPKPYDDGLFIEPAGDYDVIYGDYNTSMSEGKRPYIRLTNGLRNMTRSIGSEIKMRCEATGYPLPINFTWLKNLAPLEKNKRFRFKNKENSSKLIIIELDVLDSGYYQCSANNIAGSVNSTAILRVSQLNNKKRPLKTIESGRRNFNRNNLKQQQRHQEDLGEEEDEDNDYEGFYDNYQDDEMKVINNNNDQDDSWHVPSSAAGPGYIPLRRIGTESDGRWLDGQNIKKGDCIIYKGEACSQFLEGKYIKILIDRESIYDSEKDLLAALMTVRVMPGLSEKCKHFMHQVACYHIFKICDSSNLPSASSTTKSNIISLCRDDCINLKNSICPNEFAMAFQHDLIGDGPRALLPNCEILPLSNQNCLNILGKLEPPLNSNQPSHWCFKGFGTKYLGNAATTRSNKPCIDWPNNNIGIHPQLKNSKNYCRNPSKQSQFNEPWCYTFSQSGSLTTEPCNVPRCPPNLYLELDDSQLTGTENNISLLESFSSFWNSLSAQSQLLTFTSALGAFAFLLFIFFICCVCCCKNSGRRRRKNNNNNCQQNEENERDGICVGTFLQPESSSSMISGSLAQKQKLAIQQQQQQQHVLMHNCNGIISGSAGGGSTTLSGSDMNSAFYRKVRDERIRVGGGINNEELLNPLLPSIDSQQKQYYHQQSQQQLFEMSQQQQFRQQQPYWENSGTLNSGIAASSYPHHYIPQQSIKSQQIYNNNQQEQEQPPAEPYQISHIQERQIKFLDRILGEDSSTQLILGEWVGGMLSGAALQVALKTLKSNIPQHLAEEQFKEEIQAIGFFEHPNILRLFGVSFINGRNLCAIFDYMIHGDLIEFLKVREPRNDLLNDEQERQRNSEDFIKISTQITSGMLYLTNNGYIHKDLSARNCLVGDQQIIKICNFAKMKPQYEKDYYKLNDSCRGVPLRWMSKESLNDGRYGQFSDVYSFGVCLWEIYTYGKQPYEGYTDEQVIQFVQDGNYLSIPEFCPSAVYALMIECFNENTNRRPTFDELNSKFQKWCQLGQISALHMQQHRGSSLHSGGSGSGITSICQNGNCLNNNGGINLNNKKQYSSIGSGNVPSPAPNSSTILAGNFDNKSKQLKINSNGGISIVHSTPIVQNNNNQLKEDNINNKNKKPIPMIRRRRQAFTDEDDLDDDYSCSGSEESNES